MNEAVYKLFNEKYDEFPGADEAGTKALNKINDVFAYYREKYTAEEFDNLRDKIFEVTELTEKEWFVIGFNYATSLLIK